MDVQSRHLQHDHRFHAQFALVALLVLTMVPAAARAQVSVEVTPLRVELKTGPGGTYTQIVTLTNHDKNAVRVHARVDDWYLSKDGTPQFKLADVPMPYSGAAWIRVNPVEVVAKPGASEMARFTVTVPAGTPAGGYRAAIMFEFSPPGAEGVVSKGVMFKSRVATLVYVTVGAPKPVIDLVDVQPRQNPGQPAVVVALLKNTSPVHVRTRGQMLIYGTGGTVVRRIAVPDVPVLPESEREVVIAMAQEGQAPLPAGEYRVELRIDVGLPELLVGETMVTIGR